MEDLESHGVRTAWLAGRLARHFGMAMPQVHDIEAAARTHDIGKYFLAPGLLDKPHGLPPAERRHVEQHCARGASRLLSMQRHRADTPTLDVVVALLHHEWWNGQGYPYGLAGRDIPLPVRIVSIADVVDALASMRAYKPAWSLDEVMSYLRSQRGRQFDPGCVDGMLEISDSLLPLWTPAARAKLEPACT